MLNLKWLIDFLSVKQKWRRFFYLFILQSFFLNLVYLKEFYIFLNWVVDGSVIFMYDGFMKSFVSDIIIALPIFISFVVVGSMMWCYQYGTVYLFKSRQYLNFCCKSILLVCFSFFGCFTIYHETYLNYFESWFVVEQELHLNLCNFIYEFYVTLFCTFILFWVWVIGILPSRHFSRFNKWLGLFFSFYFGGLLVAFLFVIIIELSIFYFKWRDGIEEVNQQKREGQVFKGFNFRYGRITS